MDHALRRRATLHAALGEPHRLGVVDALRLSDRTPSELRASTGMSSNLLAFHLDALQEVGLVERRRSEGDARRRYVHLRSDVLRAVETTQEPLTGRMLFVCTANSARSQLAAALWNNGARGQATSAGVSPAAHVHPLAVDVAAARGLDLSRARPRGYDEVQERPEVVVSVCDRAREGGLPWDAPRLHWSVPDPVGHGREAFEEAADELERRVARLTTVSG